VHQVAVVVVVQVLLAPMLLEIMVVMVEQDQTPIQLGLPQQVRAIVDITLGVAVVERKTLTLIMVKVA
jgi:hypothetical protein